jgi:hypothetical protein
LAELSGHAICPRCGETVRTVDATGTPARPLEPATTTPTGPTNRQLAAIIVAVMLVMASIALAFALYTTRFRRANDVKSQEKTLPGVSASSDLGYIPDDVHVLIGIDVSQLRQSEVGQALLRQLNLSDEILLGPQVDRILVGLNTKELLPRFTIVARSTAPGDFSKSDVFKRLAYKLRNGRTLQQISLVRFGNLNAWITEPDDRTLVAAQLPGDFDVIPEQPRSGNERFAHLHKLLTQRRDDKAAIWLVGQLDPESTVIAELLKLLPAGADSLKPWQELGGAALNVRTDGNELRLSLDVRGRDVASTAAIADWIERSLGSAGVVAERKADGDWQQMIARLNADAISKWLPSARRSD